LSTCGEKMKKDEILNYLKKELHSTKEYTFIVIDARYKKPRLFEAWQLAEF